MQENPIGKVKNSPFQQNFDWKINIKLSKKQKRVFSKLFQFVFGGIGYGVIEIISRGYTHFSMFLAGGLCFVSLVYLSKTKFNLLLKCLLGVFCITTIEFIFGCVVNLWMKLDVWDYTGEAFHLLGQICPRLCFLWFILCLCVIPLCKRFKYLFNW